jgi:hypothetical protein
MIKLKKYLFCASFITLPVAAMNPTPTPDDSDDKTIKYASMMNEFHTCLSKIKNGDEEVGCKIKLRDDLERRASPQPKNLRQQGNK